MKKHIRKIKKKIKNAPKNWLRKVIRKIKRNPFKSFIWMVLGPVLIYFVARVILIFSFIATLGYIFACLIGLLQILDKPSRIITWGAGYLMGSLVIYLAVNLFAPNVKAENIIDIFAIIIILYVLFTLWFKSREMRKR